MTPPKTPACIHKDLRLALGIGAVYALSGCLWILGSDALVANLTTDPQWRLLAQRYKGLVYVLCTALALVGLVRWGYARLLLAHGRQQAQFRQLHQSLGEVLWLASPDGRDILYVSPAFDTVYGRPGSDFLADRHLWLAMVHADDRSIAIASHARLQAQGVSVCEYRICRADGAIRWVADRKKLITDDSGQVTMIGGIAEDITTCKLLDAARATTHAELEHMVAQRTSALERANADLNAFSRTVAHDLKTPLNGILGYANLLLRKHGHRLDADGQRMVQQMGSSARQMATLIDDLLALSRATTTDLCLVQTDLVPMARAVLAELQRQDPQRLATFDCPAQALAWCDAGLLRALLANLIGNAWKFTSRCAAARITLQVKALAGGLQVAVVDNGAGFDVSQAQRLFEPFQRFHAASDYNGTGIGLATCQRIVQRHGGAIWAQSAPGRGSTLTFTLPSLQGAMPVGTAANPALRVAAAV